MNFTRLVNKQNTRGMARSRLSGAWLALGVALVSGAAGAPTFAAKCACGEDKLLTVGQSMELISKPVGHLNGRTYRKFLRLNPAVRPAIYQILDDGGQMAKWPSVVGAMAYVGDKEDVPKIKQFLFQFSGSLNDQQYLTANMVFSALGGMAERSVPEAQYELQRMLRPDYWSTAKFHTLMSKAEGQLTTENEMIYNALRGLAYARDPKLEDRVKEVIASIQDAEQRKLMKARAPGMVAFRDMWIRKQARLIAEARKVHKNEQAERPARSAAAAGKETGLTDDLPPGRMDISDLEKPFVKAVCDEALAEFRKLAEQIMKNDVEGLKDRLLDDGKAIDGDQLRQRWSEYRMDLKREKGLFEALAKVGWAAYDYRLASTSSYHCPAVGEKGLSAGSTMQQSITVTFRLSKTEEIGNEQLSNQKGSLTVAKDGGLIVYMERVNAKWYWNPFGW